MKFLCTLVLGLTLAIPATYAQTQPVATTPAQTSAAFNLYNPAANAAADIKKATQQAAKEKKHVLLQIGGNWCIWCKRLNKFIEDDASLKGYQDSNYVVYHLNYSKENQNLPVLKQLGFPQRFGFPVLVILDGKGNRLHTQNSGLLESGSSYDSKKILEFFKQWSPTALDPVHYIQQ